jgi:hypothetical protein
MLTRDRRDCMARNIDLYEEPEVKSPNGDPVVNRVLTIMLAEEY